MTAGFGLLFCYTTLAKPADAHSAQPPKPAKLSISGYGLLGDRQLKRTLRTLELAGKKPEFFAPAFVEDENGKTEATAMIFPKLEKESPASSMHESAKTAPESVSTPEMKKVEPVSVTSPSTKTETETETETEIFEDAESVDLLESSDDDGFLTDEEYDILDASDEEHVA